MRFALRKYTWVINFVILAVVAVLAAIAINRLVAIALAPLTVPDVNLEDADAKTASKPRTKVRTKNMAKPLTARCLFGCAEASETGDTKPLECSEGCPAGQMCEAGICVPAIADGSLPIVSDLDLKLMGVMVARDEQYSMAVLKQGAAVTYVIGIGEIILGAELLEIYRDRIILRRNGRLEYIKLENTIMGNPTSRTANTSKTVTKGLSTGAMDLKPQTQKSAEKKPESGKATDVKKVGPNEFELDKKAVETQLADSRKLATQASVVPNYDKNGNKAGIKLVGVRSGSAYSMIGIESGDIVHKINGKTIKNQAHAFELLQSIRSASSASIEVERNGKRETFNYKVK